MVIIESVCSAAVLLSRMLGDSVHPAISISAPGAITRYHTHCLSRIDGCDFVNGMEPTWHRLTSVYESSRLRWVALHKLISNQVQRSYACLASHASCDSEHSGKSFKILDNSVVSSTSGKILQFATSHYNCTEARLYAHALTTCMGINPAAAPRPPCEHSP
jgi:hypothetical protein